MSSQVLTKPPSNAITLPLWLELRSSKGFIVLAVWAGAFTDGFLYALIVPVLPFALVDRMGVDPAKVNFWNSTLLFTHGLTQLIGSPLTGWWTDRNTSRRVPFLTGLGLAFISTVLLCIASNPWVLIVARAFGGLSSGIIFTAGLALIADSVARDEVGACMGFALSGMTWGALIAPMLGGIIYKRAGYYAIFITMLGVITFDFILRAVMIEKKAAGDWRKLAESMDGRKYGNCHEETENAIEDNDPYRVRPVDYTDQRNRACEPVAYISENEERSASDINESTPLISPNSSRISWFSRLFPASSLLISSPRLMAAAYGIFVYCCVVVSFDAILSIFVHDMFGWDSELTGLAFLAIPIPSLLTPIIGKLSDRYGARVVVLCGFGLTAPSVALLGLVSDHSVGHIALLYVLLILIGIGLNTIIGPLAGDMSFVAEDLTKRYPRMFGQAGAYAQAYGILATALAAGVMFASATIGPLYKLTDWPVSMGVLAIVCSIGSIQVYRFTGGPMLLPNDSRKRSSEV